MRSSTTGVCKPSGVFFFPTPIVLCPTRHCYIRRCLTGGLLKKGQVSFDYYVDTTVAKTISSVWWSYQSPNGDYISVHSCPDFFRNFPGIFVFILIYVCMFVVAVVAAGWSDRTCSPPDLALTTEWPRYTRCLAAKTGRQTKKILTVFFVLFSRGVARQRVIHI